VGTTPHEALLSAAELQVVQHGSRASFRRRCLDALRSVIQAPAAFICLGTDDARAYADSSRTVDGAVLPLKETSVTGPGGSTVGVKLSHAFGFVPADVCSTTRRAYQGTELYPDSERLELPYFKTHSKGDKLTQALIVFLHEGGVLFGVCGLERRTEDGPFAPTDAKTAEALAPFIVAGVRAQIAYDELAREASALRALGRTTGALFVVDRDAKKVVWAADREHGIDWNEDVAPIEDSLVNAAQKLIEAGARGEALPTPPRLPKGTVTAVAKIDDDPVFGSARVAVIRVEPLGEKAKAMDALSRREREIARLLVAGYSGVNVAAIAGLSENTVRTYVRRLYQKLSVSNRADLVRKLMAPEPKVATGPASSQIAPPDSSLIGGDDTLD
jgi:DNA-binding CsgD family transcriptional regulator